MTFFHRMENDLVGVLFVHRTLQSLKMSLALLAKTSKDLEDKLCVAIASAFKPREVRRVWFRLAARFQCSISSHANFLATVGSIPIAFSAIYVTFGICESESGRHG